MPVCSCCGRALDQFLDIAFPFPYDIAALPPEERTRRAKTSSDLCVLRAGGRSEDDRWFIRGVAAIPVRELNGDFNLGVWAEVSPDVFAEYVRTARSDAVAGTTADGLLANDLRCYAPLRGHPLVIEFRSAKERPRFRLAASDHRLAAEQAAGIDAARLHEIVDSSLRR